MNNSIQNMKQKLNDMSLNNLLGLYLLGGLVVAALVGYLLIRPAYTNLQATRTERAQILEQNDNLQKLIDDTQRLRENYDSVLDQRDEILSLLPEENEEQYLIALLGSLAQDNNVLLSNFRPETIAGSGSVASQDETGTYTNYSATVNLTGSYEAITSFLDQLESSSRFIEVRSFSASGSSGDVIADSALNLTLTLDAYYQNISPDDADELGGQE